MSKQIFINLPVADLARSVAFFRDLGFDFESRFTNESAACMIIEDNIRAMLLTHEFFASFAPNSICDATKSNEVLICISADSREEVDSLVGKAIAAGGTTHKQPQDHGFMYGHGFQDPDGHIWEVMYMDVTAMDQTDATV